jgi:hypothetical protein
VPNEKGGIQYIPHIRILEEVVMSKKTTEIDVEHQTAEAT